MKNKKILFIEDEINFANPVKIILERNGFDVLIAKDGEMGIEMANSENPDLILLDIFLPKIDGFEVLKKIKNEEKTKKIPVIIFSNLSGEEEVQKGLQLGAIDYFVKIQTSANEIIDIIKKTLNN